MEEQVQQRVERARELLKTVRHAAMATVNEDGSPHNTPYHFMYSPDLQYLYWASSPESVHSQNVARSGQIFVVLFDSMNQGGGLYIRADNAHIAQDEELETVLEMYNAKRLAAGKEPLQVSDYSGDSPQRMYAATTQQFWVNGSVHKSNGQVLRDSRHEISREDLLGHD